MRRIDAGATAPDVVARDVADTTARGGIAVLPTDTVYGVFCDARQPLAIARIYALKHRARAKALAVYVDSVDAFLALCGENGAAKTLARAFLPGALTVIVERPARVSEHVAAGYGTIGLRVPDHALCRAVLARTGPLAGTSANISGSPAYVGGAVPADFPDADVFVDDGAATLGTESTVIDVSQARASLIRAGAIPTALLEKALGVDLR